MPRPNRAFAGFCIGVVALSALVPGLCSLPYVLVEPQWVLLPDATPVPFSVPAAPGDEQPLALLSLLPSRAPPSSPIA
jgi:hypothetical protein